MSLTTSAWDRPIQGVSQQPPKVRLGGQCSIQENAVSSVVSGLVKRPGTKRVGSLAPSFPADSAYYYYSRGTGEEYFIITPPNSVPTVFDIEGNELVVENELPNNAYVGISNPSRDLRFSTISDFTFIANTTVVPEESSSQTSVLENKALINVQFADYGREYVIHIDGAEAAFMRTPDGSNAGHIRQVDTSIVAANLVTGSDTVNGVTGPVGPDSNGFEIRNGLDQLTGFTVSRVGNTILLEKDDGTDFNITTSDGADGRDVFVVKSSVKNVGDLPLYAPNNYVVRVVGEGNTNDDEYWLRAESSSGDTVRWVETVGPSQSVGFDKQTMPCVLVRDRFVGGQAVFKLQLGPWEDRTVGDDDSNNFPSFVEDSVPITSVGTFQNRLYFTAGESVVYSRSNSFFDFFRNTVRTTLDDDPIDVYADTNQVNILENSAVLDGDVVFFSANGQFVQLGENPVTAENATLQYASTFENTASCRPVAAGDVIFFAFKYGRFTGIREFYTDSFTDTKRARPVTDHVDEYILGNARQLATSTNRNQLLVLSDNEQEVYVYNWLWQGQERVQSSWSKWVFSGNVKFMAYDNETIYFLIERDGILELEYIETGDPDSVGLSFPARLDRQVSTTATRINGNWIVNKPYELGEDEDLVLVRGSGCLDAGVTAYFEESQDDLIITEGIAEPNVDEVGIILGVRYRMVYEPTMPFIKDRNGRVIDTDRLIINDVSINYAITGNTLVYVENDWGNVREYNFNGRIIGGISNLVGFAPLSPGQYTFPVRQDSDRVTFRLESVSHLPFQLRDMEWRGKFTQRGRRV